MPGDLAGVLLSAGLIAICFLAAFLVVRFGKRGGTVCGAAGAGAAGSGGSVGVSSAELARKIVHIGVSNWFFIYYFCFESPFWAIVGLAVFAVINFILTATGVFSAVVGNSVAKRSWGVVYYPLSIILLILFVKWGLGSKVDLGCALLGMGYGDGLAALIGQRFGKKKVFSGSKKTLMGSVTMLLVVALVVIGLKMCFGTALAWWALVLCSLGIGLAACLAEAVTPLGLDNVSVPIVVFLLAGLV